MFSKKINPYAAEKGSEECLSGKECIYKVTDLTKGGMGGPEQDDRYPNRTRASPIMAQRDLQMVRMNQKIFLKFTASLCFFV